MIWVALLLQAVPTKEQLEWHRREIQIDAPRRSDVRSIGNDRGIAPLEHWHTIRPDAKDATDLHNGHRDGTVWLPAEARTTARGRTVEELVELYYLSVGRGVPLVLDEETDAVRAMKKIVEATFRTSVSSGKFDRIVLQEDLSKGQRVTTWTVEADGRAIASGTTIGYKRIVRIDPITAKDVRVISDAPASLALHLTPPMAKEPVVRRDSGYVVIETRGMKVRYGLDGAEPSTLYVSPFEPKGTITVAVRPEDNPGWLFPAGPLVYRPKLPWSQEGWKIVSVDSEETEGEDGRASNAIDGDPNTFWHTEWAKKTPKHPHEIVIDFGDALEIGSVVYLPRQDGGVNGSIDRFEIHTSADGKTWTLAASGSFVKQDAARAGAKARYVKLVALSEVNGNPWASAAEISVYP